MVNLDEFVPFTREQIEFARPTVRQLRSKAVCICGHSEGSHTGRRLGLNGPHEDCRVGKVQCECKKFVAVIEASSVVPFRSRPGKPGAGHPLAQGITKLFERDPEADLRKLDAWVCAAPGCGSKGQLSPIYLDNIDGSVMPVNRDSGTTVLVCSLHASGA